MSSVPDYSGDSQPKWDIDWQKIFHKEDFQLGDPYKVRPVDAKNRIDLVCHYFARGNSIPKIAELLEERYQIEGLNRETPYTDIAAAVKEGYIKYLPSSTMRWTTQLRTICPSLKEAWIPEYGGRMAVLAKAAELISGNIRGIAETLTREYIMDYGFPNDLGIDLPPRRSRKCHPPSQGQTAWWTKEIFKKIEESREDLLKKLNSEDPKPKVEIQPVPLVIEVRLGFSGGSTVGTTISEIGRYLEPLLEQWEKDLKTIAYETLQKKGLGDKVPKEVAKRRFKVKLKLLFVNLVPGYDTDPLNHPIASLTSMVNKYPEVGSRSELRCYSSTPFADITGNKPSDPKKAPGPKQVEDFVSRYGLDIVITSAGSLEDEHSTFRNYFRGGEELANKDVYATLKRNKMEGDILWHPITSRKPLILTDLNKEDREIINFRPMTLIGLEELANQIQRGQDVVLVLAPCSFCNSAKDQVLKAILSQDDPLISHIVADRESIHRILGEIARG